MSKNSILLIFISAAFIVFLSPAFAQYKLQVGIPGPGTLQPGEDVNSISVYIRSLYLFALAIVGITALGVIVVGAIEYTISAGFASRRQDAIDRITQAVFGLVLLFAAYLILYTINPGLVTLREPNIEAVSVPNAGGTQGGGGGGVTTPDLTNSRPAGTVSLITYDQNGNVAGRATIGGDNLSTDALLQICQNRIAGSSLPAGYQSTCQINGPAASQTQPPSPQNPPQQTTPPPPQQTSVTCTFVRGGQAFSRTCNNTANNCTASVSGIPGATNVECK
ncbi:MAG: hypothetical protein HY456_02845 [Parcubacteria group bacterium]|nr:hypothetical protein [Parcubacteria group bacterium]